ncbi:MAG: hypothetical protein C0624_07960 [Desulfuromonas sp.]|nr:MAG: hypothetical protein C0624_07960 [Desulfuromonas sp.]
MKGIARKLILILFACTLAGSCLLIALEYHAGTQFIGRQVEKTLLAIEERLSISLRQSLYELDRVTTHDTILSEFSSKELQAILVWDQERHNLITGIGRDADGTLHDIVAPPQASDLQSKQFQVSINLENHPDGSVPVGEIDLYASRKHLEEGLVKHLLFNLVKVLLTVGLILAILVKLVTRYLVNPLEHIQQAMLETIRYYSEEKHAEDDIDRLTELYSANWTEHAFLELQQMEEALRDMIVAAQDRQQTLTESEKYFRSLIHSCPDSIALVRSADGRLLDLNEATTEVFGYTLEDFKETTDPTVTSFWKDPSLLAHFSEELKTKGAVDNLEVDFVHKDGHTLSTLLSARSIDYRGERCHISFIRDITEIRQANLALQQSEAQYRMLSQEFEIVLDGLVDSLMLFDRDRHLVWGNRGALKQFGVDHAQLTGRSCHQLWGDDAGKTCETCIEEIFRTGHAAENICVDEKGRTWGVKAYPVTNSNGKVVNVIQIASDLSEKIRLREDAAQAAHLAALGEMSAGIAHEINNPTGLILLALPFVKDGIESLLPMCDDYAEEHPDWSVAGLPYETFRHEILLSLEDIHGGATRVKRIVNDLKDFASEKSGDTFVEVDLRKMIETSLRLLHNTIKNSTHHFVLEIDEPLPAVMGSMQRLEQVMVNLVHNACQALTSPEQQVKLKVYPAPKGKTVILQLSDQGRGIPQEVLAKITDPFFTTRRDSGGTGLGLSVSARIIDEHGGTLKIDSEPGSGSTFTITLPAHTGEAS